MTKPVSAGNELVNVATTSPLPSRSPPQPVV